MALAAKKSSKGKKGGQNEQEILDARTFKKKGGALTKSKNTGQVLEKRPFA